MHRVLVIDDEADVRLLYRVNLRHAGFEVLEADDGERGIAAALEHLPDAVVLDLMMPRVDGFDVLRALRVAPGCERDAGARAHGGLPQRCTTAVLRARRRRRDDEAVPAGRPHAGSRHACST